MFTQPVDYMAQIHKLNQNDFHSFFSDTFDSFLFDKRYLTVK